jgi:hypothetical protein
MLAAWDDGKADQHRIWTRVSWKALEPDARLGVYVNFLDNEGEGQVRATYGGNYERLVALKNRYDPTNFFALNQNITPVLKVGEPCLPKGSILVSGLARENQRKAYRSALAMRSTIMAYLEREMLSAESQSR